ncbi:MAG: Rha family transcriptional regulator [Desulfovibrio piger]|nr:Rha family transcriptional regulator [Desulfovibrio piger]
MAQALGYALPSKAVLDHFNYAKILKYANSAGLTSSPMPSPSSPTQRFRIGTFDFQLRGLSIISEADVYGFFMRPHFTEAHGNVAPNLEAYEVVSQLIFGQSQIAFTENFLPPNLGYYGVAYHTSEAPGLPTLQGRPPSPQDGRVAIRLLPLAGLLLRRADMLDKGVYIMDTLPLCGPPCGHAALAAPKPFSTGFLSSASSSALCVWPSHPHGAFFCRTFPVSAVTSLQVAEIFGKRHDHVLREIEYILTQVPEIFVEPNFGEYEAAY